MFVSFFYIVCSQCDSIVFILSLMLLVLGIIKVPLLVWVTSVLFGTLLHLVFILIAPKVVKPSDSHFASVFWRWCRTCRLAVPPDAYHCILCHGCVT